MHLAVFIMLLVSAELQDLIKPYVLRRTKAQVALDIPEKHEVTIHHPLSDLQKKYYKALLMKDLGTSVSTSLNHQIL